MSDNDFADINPSYAGEFESFSKVRTFMASGSPRMTLRFRLAGTVTEGIVSGTRCGATPPAINSSAWYSTGRSSAGWK
ncbi:MAG: hypothetical protein H0T68_05165 [Gemmatimonadales bacterium]|nr:hypothetical protein [Gemmatimonadales bacterium]